jgi:hypothetical protein
MCPRFEDRQELIGVTPGVLLEVGFDDTAPNTSVDISSWAMEAARASKVYVIDNRALGISCYNQEYTFVEKLQTISTKFRKFRESGQIPSNFLRHYYDVHCLLEIDAVKNFIGTDKYEARKKKGLSKSRRTANIEQPRVSFRQRRRIRKVRERVQGQNLLTARLLSL